MKFLASLFRTFGNLILGVLFTGLGLVLAFYSWPQLQFGDAKALKKSAVIVAIVGFIIVMGAKRLIKAVAGEDKSRSS